MTTAFPDNKKSELDSLATEFGLAPPLVRLLRQRGFAQREQLDQYLNPQLADLPSPQGMMGMKAAVELILEAVTMQQQVIVHGDYDVDGITSTALLVDFLKLLDLDVGYHLPDRIKEGYGINRESIKELARQVRKPALFITVDCGITSIKEIQYANELGLKVIVTDHHEPGQELPPAATVINPKQKGCRFEFKKLAGVGVVFFLIMALRSRMVEAGFWTQKNAPNLKEYLDLVALGSVADVVELQGINRLLVKAGLEVLSERKRPGIWALCEQAGLTDDAPVTSEDIGYRLGPRINAAGRLGMPDTAADLLLCPDMERARELAASLEGYNRQRRKLEKKTLHEAFRQAEEQLRNNVQGLVVVQSEWHPGVVGIIAAKIAEQHQLPTLALTRDQSCDEDVLKGSGRGVEGINLFEILKECEKELLQFGGHPMAAGLTVSSRQLPGFKKMFDSCVKKNSQKMRQGKAIAADIALHNDEDCTLLVNGLQRMEPFGQGNPEPIFLLKGVKLKKVARLREHLKFSVAINGDFLHGIAFFMADQLEKAGQPVDLKLKLKVNRYQGRERTEVHAVSIDPTQ